MKKNLIFITLLSVGLLMESCGSKKDNDKKNDGKENIDGIEEATSDLPEFTSETGKFSIKFKETPKETTEDVQTAVGPIKMYMFMHEEGSTKAYMAAYCDYPEEIVKGGDPITMLQGSKEGVLGQFSATIKDEKISKFMGYDCIDFVAEGPQYNTAYKLVLAKNRLYQVGILQSGTSILKDDIDSYIGSFKINI